MTAEKLTFDEAMTDAVKFSKRHLILGNGFSIACRPDIFHYGSLYKRAEFSAHPKLIKSFEALGTQDFEVVIRNLETGSKLIPIYALSAMAASAEMKADVAALKEILVATIAGNHPDVPSEIPDRKFWACRKFLEPFLGPGNDGQVYTLNYDLLLYWVLMHEDNPFGRPVDLSTNDSFGNDQDAPDADYVVWQGESSAHSARVLFLHGALHLFDAGSELQKFTWIRTNDWLVDQARKAIDLDKFPLFVAEGTSLQKKDKIRHNAYLYQGLKQLVANANTKTHCFFIHGHSLASNDDHILRRLGGGRFPKLYVSLFGDSNTDLNQGIISRSMQLASMRKVGSPLEIAFYDAESANVWG